MAERPHDDRPTKLAFDPNAAVAHLAAADPVLGALIARVGPYAPSTTAAPDVFHSLMRAIVYQQLSGKAAGTIHRRLLDALGGGRRDADLQAVGGEDALYLTGLDGVAVDYQYVLVSRHLS